MLQLLGIGKCLVIGERYCSRQVVGLLSLNVGGEWCKLLHRRQLALDVGIGERRCQHSQGCSGVGLGSMSPFGPLILLLLRREQIVEDLVVEEDCFSQRSSKSLWGLRNNLGQSWSIHKRGFVDKAGETQEVRGDWRGETSHLVVELNLYLLEH